MINTPPAYCFSKDFTPEPPKVLVMDRHYLLYAAKGAMRLEANGYGWTLPPARAALIHAGREITVAMPQNLFACSVLFDPAYFPAPKQTLTVFEMSSLAREMILACSEFGPDHTWDDYSGGLFETLARVTWRLAETPSPSGLPTGKTDLMRKALELTAMQIDGEPVFENIAAKIGTSPRSLARKFAEEMGMTWRQSLRRLRMTRAIEFLAQEDMQITQVALAVGYSSVSAFNAAFRDFTGQTPSEYRDSFGPD